MKKYLFVFVIFFQFHLYSQNTCVVHNRSFKTGESLTYKIYYNWGALWLAAGEANFKVQEATMFSHHAYHFKGIGTTYSKYDWFYKVRDTYESYADTATLIPLKFQRDVHEGGLVLKEDNIFNFQKKKVYVYTKKNNKISYFDSIAIKQCDFDVMTAIYYARNLDFAKCKLNDTIPFSFVLDGKVYPSYIRYVGKDVIKSEVLGKVKCIKFKPKLIEGTIFKSGEFMTVWVTDDDNKIPVYVETAIVVGTIKVFLIAYDGIRSAVRKEK